MVVLGMNKKNELVRVNKEINLSKIELEEGFQNLYVNILHTVNTMEKYRPIKISKKDLIKLLGTRNQEYLHNIFLKLTGSNEIKIGNKKVYGSIFSAKHDEIEDLFTIYVNEPYQEFLFTKTDIDLLHKIKKYNHLPLTTEEADYWHKKLKEKKKFLMILNNASIKKLKGKNNKIIYSVLKEFAGSMITSGEYKGLSYRKISYKEFKEILGLSENYRNNNIDLILKKAEKDITELTEITIHSIEKFPQGRGAKKEYMIIYFYEKTEQEQEKSNKVINAVLPADVIEEQEEKKVFIQSDEVIALKNIIKQQTKNRKDKYELWAKMITISDMDKLYKFISDNDLLINLELI